MEFDGFFELDGGFETDDDGWGTWVGLCITKRPGGDDVRGLLASLGINQQALR